MIVYHDIYIIQLSQMVTKKIIMIHSVFKSLFLSFKDSSIYFTIFIGQQAVYCFHQKCDSFCCYCIFYIFNV
jgi:hypothetical protein